MNVRTGKATNDDRAVDQLLEQSRTLGQDLRKLGTLAKDAAHETLEDAKNRAAEYCDQGRIKAREMEDRVAEQVRERPLRSVLIAGGLGVLLGMLWSRRR